MASVQTSSYGGRYLKLTVIEQSTSVSANTSTVKWTLESIGGSVNYYTIYNCKVVVNGTTVYNPGTVSYSTHNFPASTGSKSGTITVKHKADGTASPISFELHGKVYNSGDENKRGTLSLSTIPRAPSYSSISASSITETSVVLSASIDSHGLSISSGGWDLSTDGGSTYTRYSGGVTSKTITGLQAGTKYWYRGYATSNGGSSNSSWGTFNTYSYPYCTSAPDFNIGDILTLQFYNPLSRSVTVNIIGADNNVCTTDTLTGTILSGFYDENCKNLFYQSLPNSDNGTYKVKVTYGQVENIKTGGKYYVKPSECSPTFNDFTYRDNNSSVVSITGNNQVFIKGYSILNAVISSANKMIANKYATANKYIATCDTRNQSANYSTNDVIINLGTIENNGNLALNVTAYDSRNVEKTITKTIPVYDYTKPVINAIATRLNNFENQTTIQVSGTYSRLTINGTDKNTISSVKYRYRETGGSWSNWSTINTTVVAGTFSCSDTVVSLANTKSWDIEIKATDNLDNTVATASIGVGQAIFFISSNNKTCYINGANIGGVSADIHNQDVNNLGDIVHIGYGYSLSNTPSGVSNGGYLINIPRLDNTNYAKQLYSPYNSDKVYTRKKDNGTWGAWELLNKDVYDSGWIVTDNMWQDFTPYNNNEDNRPRFRKRDKTVEIRGTISPAYNFSASTTYTIFTLPEGYRPSYDHKYICQGTGSNIWLLTVATTGAVYFERYRNSSSYGTANKGNWLPFNAMFFID